MPQSLLRLIERWAEFLPQVEAQSLPRKQRGIYVLYSHSPESQHFDVVYVGMTSSGERGGIRGRLLRHAKKKGRHWTHFSAFKVWDNIRDEEIVELEGLFRHIYRLDSRANALNVQRGFKQFAKIQHDNVSTWPGHQRPLKKNHNK